MSKQRVVLNSDICNGKPIIAGTRISVQSLLEFLAAGDSINDVLEEYPDLTLKDVQACIEYASKLMVNHYEVEKLA
jgi:uncharacterized protein (DUF433 family)